MAAPPSPRPPTAQSDGGGAPLSVFLVTDLGTNLAMLVAPDTSIRSLKSQVAAEHIAAFPDHGPVTVNSLQVRRRDTLFHLSESMTVMSAFTRVKGGCFLHAKITEARVGMHCCQGTPEIDGRKTSGGHAGMHVERHARELLAATPHVANDGLTHGLGGGDATAELNNVHARDAVLYNVLAPPSSLLDTKTKNEASLASDVDIDKSSKQTNVCHVVEADAMDYFLHGDRDHDVDGNANKQIKMKEEMLGQIENLSIVGKKKKKKKRLSAPSEAVSGQEAAKLPTVTVGLTKSGADAYEVDMISGDGSTARSSVLLSSLEPNDESQGGKQVQFVNNVQASTDLTSEQENLGHMHNGDRNPSIRDAINSAAEVPVIGERIAEASNGACDGAEEHEETKQHKYNGSSHDADVAETSNMKKGGKSIDALEERPTNDNISREKKRKKVKKVNIVDMASIDIGGDQQILGHTEDAGKTDKVYTEREILHGLSVGPVSDNVQQGDSNVIGNQNGHGTRKKKRRHHSGSLKGVDPNQDQKSSEHVMNGRSIQHTNSAPLDAKQTTQGSVGAIVSDSKFGENLDKAAANMINEVLADLKSRDSLSKELSEDLVTGQIHLDGNPNALEFPASTGNKADDHAALPLKYPDAIHSDTPARSCSHKKPKGKQSKVLPTMINSSQHSCGMPQEDADTKLKESDTLRCPGKASDLKDIFTGDYVVQADDKTKSTKRQSKKVKKVPTGNGKTTQSLDEQVNQVAREDIEGGNAAIQADLVRAGSVINTPMGTVTKVQHKGKRTFETQASKMQETSHFANAAQDSHDENAIGITGTHDNKNSSGHPTESPAVQEDAATLKSSSPSARKKRKKPLKTGLQSQNSAMEHDSNSDLLHCNAKKGLVSAKNSAQPNHCITAHTESDKINFLDHFSLGEMNDRLISAENIQNNEAEIMEAKNTKNTCSTEPNDLLESLPPAEKTSLTDHFGTIEVVVPSTKAENMNREYDNVNSGKEKRKRKRKPNSEGPATDKENLDADHRCTGIGTQDSLDSVVQNGRVGQDNGNENNNKVTHNVSVMEQEPQDAALDHTVEKKLHQGDVDSQNDSPINKDDANESKELRKSASQEKPHNLVKSFAMSPAASSDSTEATPQIAKRSRRAVRKVSKQRYEEANVKFKEESRKVGSGALFNDAISEEPNDVKDIKGEKAALGTSLDNSSASVNSGISSMAYDESDVPDDDEALSLSQKNLRDLDIGSILRGSRSYKKAKQKQAELLDDDTEVPDSQPTDGLFWG
ncbi:hypothetical protein QOZ80_4AG0313140 [Eleusine coracana subsp. coracana]|nr:hypothetical protein QOZ80_4AG0313140 [Eleusine coracana subsp. coracana]